MTGGGRGIGANVARALAGDGWSTSSSRRGRGIRSRTSPRDRRPRDRARRHVARVGRARRSPRQAPIELLVRERRHRHSTERRWEVEPADWWRTFEVNVLGVHLCCRAAIPGMLERGAGRIVITGSGASYLPGAASTAYPASKAAVGRYAETLANQLEGRIPVFVISPGLVRTAMTEGFVGDDAPWTPPELAPSSSASSRRGRYDALAGRVPPRRARRRRRAARTDRRGARARPERDPPAALAGHCRGSTQSAFAIPSSSPVSVKSAVPAPCFRPSLSRCQPTTTQRSPAPRHAVDARRQPARAPPSRVRPRPSHRRRGSRALPTRTRGRPCPRARSTVAAYDVAVGNGPGEDAQAVALSARCAADEALRERRVEVRRLGRERVAPRDGIGRREPDRRRARLRDERVVVPDSALVVQPQHLVERRRQPERHLHLVAAELPRDHAGASSRRSPTSPGRESGRR